VGGAEEGSAVGGFFVPVPNCGLALGSACWEKGLTKGTKGGGRSGGIIAGGRTGSV